MSDATGSHGVEGAVTEGKPRGVTRDGRDVDTGAGAVSSRQLRAVPEDHPVVEDVEADDAAVVGQVWRQAHDRPAGATPHVEGAVGVRERQDRGEAVVLRAVERPRRRRDEAANGVAAAVECPAGDDDCERPDRPTAASEADDRRREQERRDDDASQTLAPVVDAEEVCSNGHGR